MILPRHMRLIDCFGTMQHVGPLGAGHAMKALNNYVSAAGLLASMQALATAESFGITAEKFTSVINGSTGRNNTTEVKMMPFIASRRYDSGFFLRLMAKDVTIASELMTNAGFDAPITPALKQLSCHRRWPRLAMKLTIPGSMRWLTPYQKTDR